MLVKLSLHTARLFRPQNNLTRYWSKLNSPQIALHYRFLEQMKELNPLLHVHYRNFITTTIQSRHSTTLRLSKKYLEHHSGSLSPSLKEPHVRFLPSQFRLTCNQYAVCALHSILPILENL